MSFDRPEQNRAFAEKYGFGFALLCDTERKIGVAYGAADDASARSARRIGVVIDPEGRVREYAPKVDASSYPSEVLARL